VKEERYGAIESSDIIIADLTGLRHNVMIELGYALHHRTKRRLLLLFNPISGAEKVPFDTTSFRYESINEAADIPRLLTGHLKAILQDAGEGRI